MKFSDIFIRSRASLEGMAELLQSETGLAFVREVHGASVSYVAIDEAHDHRVALLFNKDDAPPFAGYTFDLEVDGYDTTERRAYARGIYEKLRRLGTLPLLLTDDFEEIESWETTGFAEPSEGSD